MPAERLDDTEERTSTESFCRPMKSFSSGGITRRIAWGSTTYRIDAQARQSERTGGRGLAPVHRLDPGSVHLRDVGGVDEHEGKTAQKKSESGIPCS